MASDHKARQQQEDDLKRRALESRPVADAAITAASQPDELEQRKRDYIKRLLNWRDGTGGPPDIREFPDKAPVALYNDAKQAHDAGRVGKGYGTLTSGANPNYAASLDKEMGLERDVNASADLENYVGGELNAADVEAGNLANAGNQRNMAIAGMRNSNSQADLDRYLAWLTRPKQPSFLNQLAVGVASGAGAGATHAI